jgi:hypothetical protein
MQNVIERAVILTTGPVLTVRIEDLRSSTPEPTFTPAAVKNGVPAVPAGNIPEALEEAEREPILAILQKSN